MDNTNFAYDDAFRTMESECDDILISLVNYFHNEDYSSKAKVIRGRNEHFLGHEDGSDSKRITDSSFIIEEGDFSRRYHYECESSKYDDSLLIRMFEYDAQIALDNAFVDKQRIRVEFPYSGIFLLRGDGEFSSAEVEIITPGGELCYPVEIRRMSDIDLEEIFARKLYFLLPFYIFNFEKQLDDINADVGKLDDFCGMFSDVSDRLRKEVDRYNLSAYSYGVIIRLINKVAYKLNMKRENVQRKVGDIMGGRVLDLDVVVAHRNGIAEGIERGIEQGIEEGRIELLVDLANDKVITVEEAASKAGMSVEEFKSRLTKDK